MINTKEEMKDRTEMNKHDNVAIMAGGIGSRFWPMSRSNYPKQFLDILNTGKTLIQQTFDRYVKFIPIENIYVITANDYVALVKQQLPLMKEENILGEPFRKNTAPCIAYISLKLFLKDPESRLIVAPADNLIFETDEFIKTSLQALDFACKNNSLVTLGVKPTYPNTGYGYIQHAANEINGGVFKVKTFTEKPDIDLAKTFLASGDFLWNAGIFFWKTEVILTAFEKYLPEIHEVFVAEKDKLNTDEEVDAINQIYPQCTSISVDFGIMEKADNVYVIPASFGWGDLGTWNSAWENMEKDYLGNAVAGKDVMVIDATQCMVHVPNNKLVILQGLDDYIVVDTKDVLLICKKEKEQEIKHYVAEVKRSKGDKYI